ncbi:alpha/beta hydrolase [Sphingomonas prati]|uniref:Acetyl esterase n=1 Tax=Sphingomonas prati TaxID=1843237 RepID=A0A7W9F2E4_9SPHN|nr:alpha/beta hydrolase [Sphingomonas prati]MBB5728390.1 acetyl esterase [Sphingomonas prati]GGE74163.1 acetylhydrolase [Sphingomonas prati]
MTDMRQPPAYTTDGLPPARPDVRAFLDYLNALPGPRSHEIGAVAARQQMRDSRSLVDLDVGPLAVLRDLSCPRPDGSMIPLRLYDPRPSRAPGPVMVFFHGGGFVIGDLDTHEPACAEIARTLDMPVVSVDYRLAPEYPWPAAPDDCETAARWVATGPADLGFGVTSLVLAGDSAGGTLTVVTALALRDRAADVPVVAQWPIYPAVDKATEYASFAQFADGYFLTREGMAWFHDSYAPNVADWRGSPLIASQHDMPATLVVTAGLDPLRDQGRAYAAKTIQAGVPTIYREAVGNVHGFISLRRAIPSSQGDLAMCLAVLKPMIAEAEANRVMAQAAPR